MKYYLGLDIGSISIKLALTDINGEVHRLASGKITVNPKTTLNSMLDELNRLYPLDQIAAVGVSGSSKAIIPPEFHWAEYSSSLAIASGLLQSHLMLNPLFK
jgi:predicted NBD/HSP70 family sugar kinase